MYVTSTSTRPLPFRTEGWRTGYGPNLCERQTLFPTCRAMWPHTTGGNKAIPAVSSAAWGSASILLISYAYIRIFGVGTYRCYPDTPFSTPTTSKLNWRKIQCFCTWSQWQSCARIDNRSRPSKLPMSAEDVAKKKKIDGLWFHAPTLSFPVAGTIMIEPTESENQAELDHRFCDALFKHQRRNRPGSQGRNVKSHNHVLIMPHIPLPWFVPTMAILFIREKAAYPLPYLKTGFKFWASVGRVDNAHGDRNLVCTCNPIEDYMKDNWAVSAKLEKLIPMSRRFVGDQFSEGTDANAWQRQTPIIRGAMKHWAQSNGRGAPRPTAWQTTNPQ